VFFLSLDVLWGVAWKQSSCRFQSECLMEGLLKEVEEAAAITRS
tara:strand:+ start:386 stop:517 length:132 start_codon:yes stop_codon:yes gene_type:complete